MATSFTLAVKRIDLDRIVAVHLSAHLNQDEAMADDLNPAKRAELMAQIVILDPQIRGLHDIAAVSISADLKTLVAEVTAERERRRDYIQNVLDAMDQTVAAMETLEANGYPALPPFVIPPELFSELMGEESDLDAAVDVFAADVAAKIAITLGQPEPKT